MSLSLPNSSAQARWAKPLSWVVLAAVVLWSYENVLIGLIGRWWSEPDYVHGFLVIPFSLLLLWLRRGLAPTGPIRGSLWGLALLALCAAMRCFSAYIADTTIEPLSLIPCLLGLVLFLGGWPAFRWTWPSIVFLVFMVPLPYFVSIWLSAPLQKIGTIASTYVIETLGIPVMSRGNVILLPHGEVGVVEACSGLRMMMLFFAVCVGAAFVMKSSLAEKILIVLTAIPIAVVANVARITVTAILYEYASKEIGDKVFHELAGFFMMPFAVILLMLELGVLERMFVREESPGPFDLPTE